MEVAAKLRDLHCCQLHIQNLPVGPSVAASSPRSAERRCATLALQSESPNMSMEEVIGSFPAAFEGSVISNAGLRRIISELLERCGVSDAEIRYPQSVRDSSLLKLVLSNVSEVPQAPETEHQLGADGSRIAADGSVFRLVCGQWFNSPSQYNDHRVGKKHKKTIAEN